MKASYRVLSSKATQPLSMEYSKTNHALMRSNTAQHKQRDLSLKSGNVLFLQFVFLC